MQKTINYDNYVYVIYVYVKIIKQITFKYIMYLIILDAIRFLEST